MELAIEFDARQLFAKLGRSLGRVKGVHVGQERTRCGTRCRLVDRAFRPGHFETTLFRPLERTLWQGLLRHNVDADGKHALMR